MESRDLETVVVALVLEPFAVIAVHLAGRFGGLDLQPLHLLVWSCEAVLGLTALGSSARLLART